MQKIFELTTKDFMTGLAISSHYPNSGIFADASGINPYRDALTGSNDTGLLQTSAAFTNVDAVNIVDDILGGTYLTSAYKGYFVGDQGHFYDVNTSSYTAASDLRSGTPITNAAEGVEIYQVFGGTKYLYYWQQSQIGRWDLSGSYPTGWTDNYIGSGGTISEALQSTKIRPTRKFVGNLYYGNKDRIGAILDLGTGSFGADNHDPNVLDFQTDLTVTTLSDDGYYLIIGATSNTNSGNISNITLNKVYFWDTVSDSWNKEYTIPTAGIASIQTIGGISYAICTNGIFAFTFSTPPVLLIPLAGGDAPSLTPGVFPTHNLATVKDDVIYWTSDSESICAYGKPLPNLTPRFFKPFIGYDSVHTFISIPDKFRLLVGTADAEFGVVNSASGGATSRTAETIYLPLERRWDIARLEINFGEPLASGDELNIDVQRDEDNSAIDWGTASFAAHGAERVINLYGSFTAENLKLFFNFNGGNVKIKKITGYGYPVET